MQEQTGHSPATILTVAKRVAGVLLFLSLLPVLVAACSDNPAPEATQTPTATATPVPTARPTATATPVPAARPTATATPVPAARPTATGRNGCRGGRGSCGRNGCRGGRGSCGRNGCRGGRGSCGRNGCRGGRGSCATPVPVTFTEPGIFNDNVFVLPISDALAVDGVTTPLELEEYTKRFYAHFEDEFDFLFVARNLVHGVDILEGSAFYIGVKNDVQGIGEPLFSDAGRWGSSGRLQGVINFRYVGTASPGLHEWTPIGRGPGLHEVMHRWANRIVPTVDGAHWGFSSANGLLGGFDITNLVDHGNGRYTAGRFNTTGSVGRPFSPIELYLAGLASAEEVPDLWVAEDGAWLLDSEGNKQFAANGYPLFTASRIRTLTFEDIVAEHGHRTPAVDQSQRNFRAALILLVNEEHPADLRVLEKLSEEVSWVSVPAFTDEGDKRRGNALRYTNFYESTDGQATISMDGLSQLQKNSQEQ